MPSLRITVRLPVPCGVLASLAALVALATPCVAVAAPRSKAARRLSVRAGAAVGAPRAHASIVGGLPAEPGTFPWLAAVFHEGPGEGFLCTGTVVAPNVILTAAHCAEDVRTGARFSAAGYAVVTGNVDFAASSRQVNGRY